MLLYAIASLIIEKELSEEYRNPNTIHPQVGRVGLKALAKAPLEKGDEYMSIIRINKAWCKRCDICVEVCPKDVLALDKKGFPIVVNEESCNKCKLCEFQCPDLAIEIVEESDE